MAKKSKAVRDAERLKSQDTERTQATTRRATRRPEAVRARKDARRKEAEKQARQWLYTKIGIGVVVVALLASGVWIGYGKYEEWQVTKDVESYFGAEDFVNAHLNQGDILYEQIPPVGGPHRSAWQNCGFYDKYINNENAVHAMEHGSVWITYDPNLPADDIEVLRKKTEQQFVLVSPYPGMDAPVVASVWGKQIKLDGVNDDRLDPFIRKYRKNPGNSPEPQGICWGNVSATTDKVPQQEPFVRQPDTAAVGGVLSTDATATAAVQNPVAPTVPPTQPPAGEGTPPPSTPVSSPVASPAATPGGTPKP